MNFFVIDIRFNAPKEEVQKYIEQHREFLDRGLEDKTLIISGAQNPKVGGIIVARFWSLEEAVAFTHRDPLFVAGVAEYKITEFLPSRFIGGLKELLDSTPPEV